MKKLFLILSFVATLVFTGCDNDNSVNPQPLGKATISGIVYADFDNTDTDNNKDVVANTKMIVSIEDNNENGSVRYTEVTTDANGKYSLEIELGNMSLYVYIKPVDFRADVKTADGTESRIFHGDDFNFPGIWVEKGNSLIYDISYND